MQGRDRGKKPGPPAASTLSKSGSPVTIPAMNGSCQAPLLPPLQVAAFTLPMIGVLQVQPLRPGKRAVTFPALLHRLPLLPEVASLPVLMVALAAVHPRLFMHLMAEEHRRPFPGLVGAYLEAAHHRGLIERPGLGPQHPQQAQAKDHHSPPTAPRGQGLVNPGNTRRRKRPIPRR